MRSAISLSAVSLSRSEEHTSELQSLRHLVCRLLLEKNDDRDAGGVCSGAVQLGVADEAFPCAHEAGGLVSGERGAGTVVFFKAGGAGQNLPSSPQPVLPD